jgi:hypothetical protein
MSGRMTGHSRLAVAALVLAALLAALLLLVYAAAACPTDTPGHPCPAAALNRAIVVALAAAAVTLMVVPFAFLAEFAMRRRIVYHGAWGRAARRGLLAGVLVATLAGLRLGEALSVPVAIFVLLLLAIVEWFAIRRFDLP